jgi:hypothetical protein
VLILGINKDFFQESKQKHERIFADFWDQGLLPEPSNLTNATIGIDPILSAPESEIPTRDYFHGFVQNRRRFRESSPSPSSSPNQIDVVFESRPAILGVDLNLSPPETRESGARFFPCRWLEAISEFGIRPSPSSPNLINAAIVESRLAILGSVILPPEPENTVRDSFLVLSSARIVSCCACFERSRHRNLSRCSCMAS